MLADLRQLAELAHGALDVPHPPAAAGDDHHAALLGQAERAPSLQRTARPEEIGRDQRAHEAHAALPGDPLDRRHRLAVHHQVHVDPGLRPEEQARQVGDRRHRGAVDHFGAPQPREHDRDRRVGGDDHVGVVFGDAPRQRARAQQPQQPARKPANRRDVLEQPVDERVRPRHQAQLHAIAVLDHGPQHPSHRREAVDDRDLGLLGRVLDLIGQRPRGRGMTLADVGGQDQDAARAGGIRNRVCGFAVRRRRIGQISSCEPAGRRRCTCAQRKPPANAAALYRVLEHTQSLADRLDVTMSACRRPLP